MTNDFDFPTSPRLQSPLGRIVVEEDQNSLAYVSGFIAYITPRSYYRCENAGGLYRPDRALLYLCLDPAEGLTDYTPSVLIHEYFHAIQYGYTKVFDPDSDDPPPPPEAWIIEGMATMAMESYFLEDEVVRSANEPWQKPLLVVNASPRHGVWGDDAENEYHAQDFWVYIGQRFGEDLGYLDPILEEGGATTEGTAVALEGMFGIPFKELYWGFVRNQIIENLYDLGDANGTLCTLNEAALFGPPVQWPYHPLDYWEYPHPSGALYDTIPPLTARLIEVSFPPELGRAFMMTELEACQGLSGSQRNACILLAQQDHHSKIYINRESDCELDPNVVEGTRSFELSEDPGERYFVLLANVDLYAPHGYSALAETSLRPRE
jgi:hypothetical protein